MIIRNIQKIGCLFLFLALTVSIFSKEAKSKVDPDLSIAYSQYLTLKSNQTPQIRDVKGTPGIKSIVGVLTDMTPSIDLTKKEPIARVLVHYEGNADLLKSKGFKVQSQTGDFLTVHLPLSRLSEFVNLEEVKYIELGKPLEPHLNVSDLAVRGFEGRDAFSKTGNGVIVIVLDTGIDIDNPDFQKPNGDTRILYLWDQTSSDGSLPFGYDYGTEWTANDINNGNCTEIDDRGHGTHVAGIAAGNGSNTGSGVPAGTYVGMAPEADLIVAKLDLSNFANAIDGLLWAASKASDLNKPWTANLSLGTIWGPKDGTTIFEQYIGGVSNNAVLGKGRIPVISAGNEGYDPADPNRNIWDRYHMGREFTGNAKITINSNSGLTTEYMKMQIWYPEDEDYEITITAPSGRTYGPFGPNSGTGGAPGAAEYWPDPNTTDGLVMCHNEHFDGSWPKPDNYQFTTASYIYICLFDYDISGQHFALRSGTWEINMSSGSGRWDAYIVESKNGVTSYFDASTYENARIISEPGNAFNTITVGSFNSKNSWIDYNGQTQTQNGYPIGQISYFSSPGPTRDGRNKPDIYAPGAWIASSLTKDRNIDNSMRERDGKHWNSTGTSFAAPHITGAVALLLEQNEDYTIGDIKDILDESKTIDGYLDIYAALEIGADWGGIEDCIYATGPTNLNQTQSYTFQGTFYDASPEGDYIVSPWTWQLHAYHDGGTEILASGSSSGSTQTSWNCTVPILTTYNKKWVRDNNNRIQGYIFVSARDNDNIIHTDELTIGINAVPDKPLITGIERNQQSLELSFIAGGASGYKVYYDTDPNPPYNGIGADQGNSPIDVGGSMNIALTGLASTNTYYLAVKAYNNTGESVYSNEVSALADLILQNITVEIDSTKHYATSNSITAAGNNTYFLIKGNGSNGGNVTMQAGNLISLLAGFEAREGCTFDAYTNNPILSDEKITGPLAFDYRSDSTTGTSSDSTAVELSSEETKETIPTVFSCAQNYPNPFMRNTTIKYGLPKNSNVNLTIFNIAGQAVKTLVNGQQLAGFKSVRWNGENTAGVQVPQGIYFYVFRADDFEDHRKMVFLK